MRWFPILVFAAVWLALMLCGPWLMARADVLPGYVRVVTDQIGVWHSRSGSYLCIWNGSAKYLQNGQPITVDGEQTLSQIIDATWSPGLPDAVNVDCYAYRAGGLSVRFDEATWTRYVAVYDETGARVAGDTAMGSACYCGPLRPQTAIDKGASGHPAHPSYLCPLVADPSRFAWCGVPW